MHWSSRFRASASIMLPRHGVLSAATPTVVSVIRAGVLLCVFFLLFDFLPHGANSFTLPTLVQQLLHFVRVTGGPGIPSVNRTVSVFRLRDAGQKCDLVVRPTRRLLTAEVASRNDEWDWNFWCLLGWSWTTCLTAPLTASPHQRKATRQQHDAPL